VSQDSLGVSGFSSHLWILGVSLDSLNTSVFPRCSPGCVRWILLESLDILGILHSLTAQPGYAHWILSAPLDSLST
jgi:hypothetical protein